jgi:hypothetical protein
MFIRIWHKKVDFSVQCRFYITKVKGTTMTKVGELLVPRDEFAEFRKSLEANDVDFMDDVG